MTMRPAISINHRAVPPVLLGDVRLYANDTTIVLRWNGGDVEFGPDARYTGRDIDTHEIVSVVMRPAILAAARRQGIRVHYLRPKAKLRGRGRRLRKWWAYNAARFAAHDAAEALT